ncbi:MAG: glycoside hydrolase family 20 zincin-like fold domain-containing protein [Armatimonadota bacterium]|nr:glycoside hydrolase family 20 zincin-like fold domain-containing protein [Armatimonadota bacterium]
MRWAPSAAPVVLLMVAASLAPAWSHPGVWPDAYRTPTADARIIPAPKVLRWLDAPFEFGRLTRIVVGPEATAQDLYAARELNDELAAWGAAPLEVVRAPKEDSSAAGLLHNAVLVGEPAANPAVARALAQGGLWVTAREPGPEGYVLEVAPDRIVAAGTDRRGTFYAVQTLRQLIHREGGRLLARGAMIRDWPDHPIRAVHVVLDSYSDVFHVALIDRVLGRYKFNMLIAEAQYVRWDSARAIWHPQGATKAQAAAVVAAAREHLMEPVPLIQTLGHAEWLFYNDQNLDLLEMPADVAPARYAYDPLNPRVYDVVLPILDEAVVLFGARALHIGHDEVRNVVPFPWSEEGRRLGFGELFVRDTVRLYEHLRRRGVRTMMWGDVLLTNDYDPALQGLPRDIVMVDWQYHPAARYPSLGRFRAWGYEVLAATWYRHDNIAALSHEARKAGAGGMVRTTWTGYFGNRSALQAQYHQIASYLAAAEHFWNAGAPAPALDEIEAARRFRLDWQAARPAPETIPGQPLDLRGAVNVSHVDDGAGWLGKGAAYDLRNLPGGLRRLGGVQFLILDPEEHRGRSVILLRGTRRPLQELPEGATVGFGGRAGELCFLHALPYPATRYGERVATYRVRFGDGGAIEIPVRYRIDIGSWLDDPVSMDHEVVWTGRTRSGIPARLTMLCWVNSDPQRPIVAIDLRAANGQTAPAVFAITALDRPRASGQP